MEDADAIQPFPGESVHRDSRRNYCKLDQIEKIHVSSKEW